MSFVIIYKGDLVRITPGSSGRYELQFTDGTKRMLYHYEGEGEINGWSFKHNIEDEDDRELAEDLGKLIEEEVEGT